MSGEIYDVNDYTDENLYEILNLTNPTDRELEAKILQMIKKYENMNTESSDNLVDFFEQIYDHFFQEEDNEENNIDDEEEEINYDAETKEEKDELMQKLQERSQQKRLDAIQDATTNFDLKQGSEENIINEGKEGEMITKLKNKEDYLTEEEIKILEDIKQNPENYNPTKRRINPKKRALRINNDSEIVQQRTVGYTKPIEYVQGQLNPIYKTTIKRIISIDSQYRVDKRSLTTEFTCNLSEPLRDVVSLKLYSIQIPFTWYTISKNFGSNFIFIKGNTPGIDNSLHDVKIDISAGNYLPGELDTTIDESITQQKSVYTDVSFGTTNIFYDRFTSLCDFTVDLNKTYNEHSYQLEFQNWTSPYFKDSNRNTNIAAYLGFEEVINNINTITSYPMDTDPNQQFIVDTSVDTSNNYFKVIKYRNSGTDTEFSSSSIIDDEILVKMSLTGSSYSRIEIINDINNQIQANPFFINSSISRNPLSSNNKINTDYMTDISYSVTEYTKLQIKPNRHNTFFYENNKVYVEFPNDTRIWLGNDSCLQFDVSQNQVDYIRSTRPIVEQTDRYYVHTSPHVELKCNIPGFEIPVNDFSFNIPNSHVRNNKTIDEDIDTGGYTLNEYIQLINQSINDISTNLLTNKLIDISAAPLTQIYSSDPPGTNVYTTTDENEERLLNIFLNFEKRFDEQYYYIDFSNSIFTDVFHRSYTDNVNTTEYWETGTDLSLNKLTNTIRNTEQISASIITVPLKENTKICTIYPIDNNNTIGNEGDVSYNIMLPYDETSSDPKFIRKLNNYLPDYMEPITDAFNKFIDPISGLNIFENTNISYTTVKDINNKEGYNIDLNIKINKVLNARGYTINFVDNVTIDTNNNYVNSENEILNKLSEKETWKFYLKIDPEMINQPYDLSNGNLNEITNKENTEGTVILIVDNNRDVTIKGSKNLEPNNLITIINNVNNKITIRGVENGVASSGGENDIIITLDEGQYNKIELLNLIQTAFTNYTSPILTFVGNISISKRNYYNIFKERNEERDVTKIDLTITRNYTAKDYKVVFFDETSFVTCYVGVQSVRNTTWDSTLGWVLGYRLFTVYDLNVIGNKSSTNAIRIKGDTGFSANLYNYFLLCLDDYNQNHLNDGLITIANNDTSIPLPSYANRTDFQCDPTTGEKIYNINSNLTEKQIYAATEIANSTTVQNSIGSSVSTKSYGTGPYVKDVFGLIPIKVSGLKSGDSYVEFGGTLQNQERSYFGPVNIQRLTIRLMTDRGDVVDLNSANWSFSLICEQLNKATPKNESI